MALSANTPTREVERRDAIRGAIRTSSRRAQATPRAHSPGCIATIEDRSALLVIGRDIVDIPVMGRSKLNFSTLPSIMGARICETAVIVRAVEAADICDRPVCRRGLKESAPSRAVRGRRPHRVSSASACSRSCDSSLSLPASCVSIAASVFGVTGHDSDIPPALWGWYCHRIDITVTVHLCILREGR